MTPLAPSAVAHGAVGTRADGTGKLRRAPRQPTSSRVSIIAGRPLDDHLSSLILDRYLDAIDSQRQLLLSRATSRSSRSIVTTLDDAIKAGDVEPAFVIFRRFQQRSRERMNYAVELLAEEARFRSSTSRSTSTARKEPWPANAAEMNELWRKRVKNDALSLDHRGQAVARGRPTSCASVTSTSKSAWIKASPRTCSRRS